MAAAATEVKMEEAVEHVEIGVVDDVEVEDNTIPVDKDEFKVDVNHLKLESEEVPECTIDETLQPSTSTAGVVTIKEEQLDELDCESDDSDSMDIREFKEEPPEEDFDEEMMLEDGAVDTSLTEDVDIKFEATEETLQDAKGKRRYKKRNQHQKIKKPEKTTSFICSECPYKTNFRSVLRQHLLVHGPGPIKFKCNICPYEAKRKSDLNKHLLRHNPKATMYKCDQCPYETIHKSGLHRHALKHNPEVVTFKCRQCDFETEFKQNLVSHLLIHNVETSVFKCSKCHYGTNYEHIFEQHLLTHNSEGTIL